MSSWPTNLACRRNTALKVEDGRITDRFALAEDLIRAQRQSLGRSSVVSCSRTRIHRRSTGRERRARSNLPVVDPLDFEDDAGQYPRTRAPSPTGSATNSGFTSTGSCSSTGNRWSPPCKERGSAKLEVLSEQGHEVRAIDQLVRPASLAKSWLALATREVALPFLHAAGYRTTPARRRQ
jgi:hypothetical protein